MTGERIDEEHVLGPDAVLRDTERRWSTARAATRIAVGIHDLGLHQEVQDFLGRDPKLEIVGAAVDADRLVALMAERAPTAALVCPKVARELRHPTLSQSVRPLVVVAEDVTVTVLREAIEAGARAVFGWPEERAQLARSLAAFRAIQSTSAADRALVVGVHGARGGAGATFVATHLAAAFAALGSRTVLIDLDASFADVTPALGTGASQPDVRTIQDLLPVIDELEPAHVEDVLFPHDRGFEVLLGPPESREPTIVRPGLYRAAIALLAGQRDVIVAHLPRSLDRIARTGAQLADRILLVTTLDLFALYGARRSMALLARNVPPDRWWVVVNRPARSALTERDVERVLGRPARIVIRADARVPRAQARGELLPERVAGSVRDMRKLVTLLLDESRPDRAEAGP